MAVPEEPVQLKMKLHCSSDLATEPVRQATTQRARLKKLLSRPTELLQNISSNARELNPVSISKGSPSLLNLTLALGEYSSLRPQLHDLLWPSTSGSSPAARRCPVSCLASYLPTSRYPGWPHLQHLCLLRPGETPTAVLNDDSETTAAARLRCASPLGPSILLFELQSFPADSGLGVAKTRHGPACRDTNLSGFDQQSFIRLLNT